MNQNTDETLFDNRDGIAVITLNRPHALNALTMGMVDALYEQMGAWANDDSVRAVVIRGAGDRAFCAGGDVVAVAESRKDPGNTLREESGCSRMSAARISCRAAPARSACIWR